MTDHSNALKQHQPMTAKTEEPSGPLSREVIRTLTNGSSKQKSIT